MPPAAPLRAAMPALAGGRAPALALAAGLGALQTLAFVHTTWLWWLPFAGAALLAALAGRSTPRQAAGLGWAYGTAWLTAGTWWLFVSLHRYGGLPAWMAALAVLLLSAFLALYLALALALFARWRSARAWRDGALFAALWLLAELARGVVFTGFPWLATGYAFVDAPLAGLAPWLGVYGVGAVMALAAAWAGSALAGPRAERPTALRRLPLLAAAAALLLLPGLLPHEAFSRPRATLGVALLQTNVEQDEKFAPQRMPEALAWVADALMRSQADLVIGPETAIPLLPQELAELTPGYWERLRAHFATGSRAALVGVPLGDFTTGYTNSVAGLSAAASPEADRFYRYDKFHLVPFGEFIPPGFRWFTEMMNIPLGDFARGVLDAPSFAVKGERVAPNICYEDLFGEELARRFADPARAPTLFANVSNIAWFGDTVAIGQHLNISRFRTLEFERPMVRATNTGATAVIDHRGRVQAALPPFTRGVLEARVQARDGTTPFAWWASRMGLWPLFGAALAVVVAAALRARRNGLPSGPST